MRPLLRQNRDLVVIKRMERPYKKYDAVLFKRDNGQYVLHRILKVRDSDFIIVGDNCRQKEVVRADQLLGLMTEVVRDGKKIQVTDKGYLCYVHLWCDLFWLRCIGIRGRELLHAAAHRVLPKFVKEKVRQNR